MADPTNPDWLAPVLTKMLPACLGAAIMVAVDLPATKRELFARVFVALVCSLLFTEFTFDFLHGFGWFAFLNESNKMHVAGIAGFLGAVGWFVIGGMAMWLRRFKVAPIDAVKDAKGAIQ